MLKPRETSKYGSARREFDAANEQNMSLKEPKAPPEVTKSQTYFGMSLSSCTEPQRLKLIWSILVDCIEERKDFRVIVKSGV